MFAFEQRVKCVTLCTRVWCVRNKSCDKSLLPQVKAFTSQTPAGLEGFLLFYIGEQNFLVQGLC